tara:strand:+ start:43 stop:303 length:261 start_codon:yes stop_codon:yes gene_type:complete
MKFPLYRTDMLRKYLKTNWEHWDEKRMVVQKQHNGYDFYLYFAVDNHLITEELDIHTESSLKNSLSKISNNRVYKIKRLLESDENS